MKTVIILTEGQCEETFIRDVVAPAFHHSDIFIESRCIPTSKTSRGGAVTFNRFMLHARNTLCQRRDTYVSTMLDLYGLDTDFPISTWLYPAVIFTKKQKHWNEDLLGK